MSPAEITLHPMQPVARFLQLLGLTVPPLAMAAQLAEQISSGKMLGFLGFAVCLFCLGYLLQQVRS